MSIKKHLPKPKTKELLQARIDADLYTKLRERLAKNKVKMVDFVEASVKSYLEGK